MTSKSIYVPVPISRLACNAQNQDILDVESVLIVVSFAILPLIRLPICDRQKLLTKFVYLVLQAIDDEVFLIVTHSEKSIGIMTRNWTRSKTWDNQGSE